jgi:hypothetical protein
MQRRTLLPAIACLCVGAIGPARHASAQRVTQPIARPPGQRAAGALVSGRFNPGVAAGPAPGLFTVVSVDARASTLQLKDEGERSGLVHVNADMFDVEDLKAGDLVEVDFLVPVVGSPALEAAGIWKVQR